MVRGNRSFSGIESEFHKFAAETLFFLNNIICIIFSQWLQCIQLLTKVLCMWPCSYEYLNFLALWRYVFLQINSVRTQNMATPACCGRSWKRLLFPSERFLSLSLLALVPNTARLFSSWSFQRSVGLPRALPPLAGTASEIFKAGVLFSLQTTWSSQRAAISWYAEPSQCHRIPRTVHRSIGCSIRHYELLENHKSYEKPVSRKLITLTHQMLSSFIPSHHMAAREWCFCLLHSF